VYVGYNINTKNVTKRGTAFIQETGEVVNLHTSPLETLGIDRHYFSAILGKLVKHDLIKRGETRGIYYINPQFA
jgi:CRP-like cAMP-binding protein